MVFYRKYRPQTIEELDSLEIRDKLYSILSEKSDSISHAFLFSGPKGLGKTSTARILAKVLNCEKLNASIASRKINPCNKCSQCISISKGTNLDVLEIDGASNRGIDEIRDLREKIRLSPVSARKKVYIIDEVHMLTTEAFNALLKTLEEPPSHAVFVLCTTELHKVPSTILSRCFHISFKLAKEDELVRSFARIAKEENISIDSKALQYLSSLADGSFRDGVKILEEILLSLGQKDERKITIEILEEKYKFSNLNNQVLEMICLLGKKDRKGSFALISNIVNQGMDMKYFIEQLISSLHEKLLAEVGLREAAPTSSNYAFSLSLSEIKKLIELLIKAYSELKFSVLSSLPLEIAVIDWTQNFVFVPEEKIKEEQKPIVKKEEKLQDKLAKEEIPQKFENEEEKKEEKFDKKSLNEFSFEDDDPKKMWVLFIERVKPYNHSVAGVLRGCSLKSFNKEKFIIESKYKFHKERLEDKKVLQILGKAAKDIVGNLVDVSVIMKGK